MSVIADFKDFMFKTDFVGLAVAVVIGVALNALVTSLVTNIITPLIGIPGHANFSGISYTINGSVFYIGTFINSLTIFFTVAFVIFMNISTQDHRHSASSA